MIGSEKQIKWANDIKAGWISDLKKEKKDATDRVERGSMPAIWKEIVEQETERFIEFIDKMDDAGIVIKDRKAPVVMSVMDQCYKKYEQWASENEELLKDRAKNRGE